MPSSALGPSPQIKANYGNNQKEYGLLKEVQGYEIRFCGIKGINFEGINLDCDVDLIKLSASGGNRKMRSMLLKQGVHLQGMRPRGGRSLNDVSLNTFEIFKVRFSRCSGKNIIEHSGSITEL
ncbi:hypothetical protein F2Q68_00043901 [Brassica cretica]|uniref:Uncharacterized protein n=1 Tax=Brassica cretica TaxID=69181 RepID=A0A8S9LIH8_BRACR|nr:hypothetical protein F2Q68_00043901 [Brassica cretica]